MEQDIRKQDKEVIEKVITDGILQCYGTRIPREYIIKNDTLKRVCLESEGNDLYKLIPVIPYKEVTLFKIPPDFGDAFDLEEEEKYCQFLRERGFEEDIEFIKAYACQYRQHLKLIIKEQASKEGIEKSKDPIEYRQLKKEWTSYEFLPLNHIGPKGKLKPKEIGWTRDRKIYVISSSLPPANVNSISRNGYVETVATYLATFINEKVIMTQTEVYFSYTITDEWKFFIFISHS